MYCIHCGKLNVDQASFCAYCGKATSSIPDESSRDREVEGDYNFYSQVWSYGKGGRWNLTFGVTEYSVRLDNWGSDQNRIMPELQEYLDAGWQYINPPGPNSYRFISHTDDAGGIRFTWLSVSSFIVDFRRPARPLKDKEKLLIGVWQELYNPNAGFLNKLGNLAFSHKTDVSRERYKFRKDHTVRPVTRDGEVIDLGVFFELTDGQLHLYYKHTPERNTTISMNGNRLTIDGLSQRFSEFERVSE